MHNEPLDFHLEVTKLLQLRIIDRSSRMETVQALIERYWEQAGKSPDSAQLERLTDYILQEELQDPDPYKMSHNDHPIMSAWQYDLRRQRESSLKIAEEIGSDGKRYSAPHRRRRSKVEMLFMDEQARIRNAQRASQYAKATEAGPVVTYHLRDLGGTLNEAPFSVETLTKK
ncbi:hypothetical protein [Paenibacillus sp. UNC451MF]|uniref:hypothetical protein n=1 Tax=Paenibacillus sp. UNC451MF TaxID=1449063 RepID=UPI000689D028|nr:hypothetical protein [Paenibacillus sp. UNC451MF]